MSPMSARLRRRGARPLVAMTVAAALAGCSHGSSIDPTPSPPTGPRPLTDAEAQRLAVVRVNDLDRGRGQFRLGMTLGNNAVVIVGVIDWTNRRGFGVVKQSAQPKARAYVEWTAAKAAALALPPSASTSPLPATGWSVRALDPSTSGLDTGLALLLDLASDRPENPLLLQQNGARWLGSQVDAGVRVDVMSGPTAVTSASASTTPSAGSNLTYYVDRDGYLTMLRARLPGIGSDLVVTFPRGKTAPVILIPALLG